MLSVICPKDYREFKEVNGLIHDDGRGASEQSAKGERLLSPQRKPSGSADTCQQPEHKRLIVSRWQKLFGSLELRQSHSACIDEQVEREYVEIKVLPTFV